jgi:hypothetical protein
VHPSNLASRFRCLEFRVRDLRNHTRWLAGTPLRYIRANAATVDSKKPAVKGPTILNGQVAHSILPHRLDVIHSLEKDGWVERELPGLLQPVENIWQPADFLPDGADEDFIDKVCFGVTALCLDLLDVRPAILTSRDGTQIHDHNGCNFYTVSSTLTQSRYSIW